MLANLGTLQGNAPGYGLETKEEYNDRGGCKNRALLPRGVAISTSQIKI